ncbi:MAG: type III pantothenate kinase [Chitinophagaceae bacterium]|nr:type III pantothenate kinase [Chitinophagaceae bacterium]
MADTTLCFDFGNTRKKFGVFVGDEFVKRVHIPDDSPETLLKVIHEYQPARTLLSSVIHHNTEGEKVLRENSDFLLVGTGLHYPFSVPVSKPETVGADRLAIAAYAVTHFPQQNNLVIALGSCITYNFINKYHLFLGGSISPGMEMRFKSMHDWTALLPLIKPNWEFPLIGYDTRTNLLSGVMLGIAGEINGIIEAYAEKFSNFNVLLTGGDLANFARHIKYKIFADPALILKGLYAISKFNHEKNN